MSDPMSDDLDLDARIGALITALSHMGEPHLVAEDSGRRTSYEIEHLSKDAWSRREDAVAVIGTLDGARSVLRDALTEVKRLRTLTRRDGVDREALTWARSSMRDDHERCKRAGKKGEGMYGADWEEKWQRAERAFDALLASPPATDRVPVELAALLVEHVAARDAVAIEKLQAEDRWATSEELNRIDRAIVALDEWTRANLGGGK